MQNNRIKPQAIAASEYKPSAKPVIIASRSVSSDPAVAAALDVMRQLSGAPAQTSAHSSAHSSAHVPVRAVVAKPSVSKPSDNIATPIAAVASTPVAVVTPATVSTAVRLSAENAELRQLYAELSAKYAELSAKYGQTVQISADLDDITAQFLSAEQQVQDLNERVATLQEQNAELSAKYDATKAAGRARNQRLEEQVIDLQSQVNTMASQLSNCNDYDSILSQLINSEENVTSLEEELAAVKSKLQNVTLNHDRTVQGLQATVASYREECENARGVSKTLEDVLANERSSHAELKAKYSKLSEATRQFITLTSKSQ